MFAAPPTEDAPIDEHLQYIATHMYDYKKYLNEEAIWLFLATLGSWSVVSHHFMQATAGALTFGLFLYRFLSGLSDKRTFATLLRNAESRINGSLEDEDKKKSRLYELCRIKYEVMPKTTSASSNWPFLLVSLYSAVSFLFFIQAATWSRGA